jgi:hypothetical protein
LAKPFLPNRATVPRNEVQSGCARNLKSLSLVRLVVTFLRQSTSIMFLNRFVRQPNRMLENALSAFMPSAGEHCKSKVRPLGGGESAFASGAIFSEHLGLLGSPCRALNENGTMESVMKTLLFAAAVVTIFVTVSPDSGRSTRDVKACAVTPLSWCRRLAGIICRCYAKACPSSRAD